MLRELLETQLVPLKKEQRRLQDQHNEQPHVKVVTPVHQEVLQHREVHQESRMRVAVLLQELKVLEAEHPQKDPRREVEEFKNFLVG